MMKKITQSIKVELWKTFHNPLFFISIMIGLSLVLLDSIKIYNVISELIKGSAMLERENLSTYENLSLYGLWLPIGGYSSGARTFLYIWPVLAALPYGWSYWSDRKNGSYGQITMQTGKGTYYLSKWTACFISGGLAIAMPLFVNLLADALFCPIPIPSVQYQYYPIINGWFFSKLFYTHSWIYCLLWCGISFLWGGVTATLCMAAGSKPRFMITIILIPFLFYMLTEVFLGIVVRPIWRPYLTISPIQMIMTAPGDPNPAWLVLGEWGLLLILSLLLGQWQVVKHEF